VLAKDTDTRYCSWIHMPSGKTHLKIEWTLLALWSAVAAILIHRTEVTLQQTLLFLVSYVFSMLLLSPDLDLSDSTAYERWGALRWLWRPYAWAFRHRQLSHHILLGPLTRAAYLGAIVGGAAWAYVSLTGAPRPHIHLTNSIVVPICLGVYLPNIEHIVADRIVTARRRRNRRGRL
jgi:uncharacterized metal-binding protein